MKRRDLNNRSLSQSDFVLATRLHVHITSRSIVANVLENISKYLLRKIRRRPFQSTLLQFKEFLISIANLLPTSERDVCDALADVIPAGEARLA
jgi:hypothetical protein